MDRPPDLERQLARGEIPQATCYGACVVCSLRGRFVFGGLVAEPERQDQGLKVEGAMLSPRERGKGLRLLCFDRIKIKRFP